MKKQFKSSASAARAFGTSSPAFGLSASTSFGTSSSPLSYLNELPDLSSVSDSNVVVAFKNLSKRDATTKAKALEDLQALLVNTEQDIEEGVLDAWTNIYPRTSIDTSRRVRQLAHTLNGQIAARSGKRIAKRMPTVVGAWLAGQYDNDKAVARAASEALAVVFTTPEKRQALWKAYQDPLLDFSKNILDKETPKTLSDERSVSPDEANAKYYRVVASAIGLLSGLMGGLSQEDFQKHIEKYTEILQDKKLWEKAFSEDVAVRRAIHKLLLHSPNARPCLNMALLSSAYITKGADSDQSGSASDYLEVLLALTTTDSTVWTEQWKDKKPPSSRLKALVKRGSQGAPLNYWSTMSKLFKIIPSAALPTDPEKASDIIKAFFSGVTRKDEPRPYVLEGLKAYVHVTSILSTALPRESQSTFCREAIFPLVSQYVLPKAENAKWNLPGNAAPMLMQEVRRNPDLVAVLIDELPTISADLTREIKLSLPEQAKDYARSQDELARVGERFASLVVVLTPLNTAPPKIVAAAGGVLKEAFAVILNRVGKPYGATAVASAIVNHCRTLIDEAADLSTIVEEFLEKHIAMIYVSASYKQLASILSACEDQDEVFKPAWTRCLNACLETESKQQYDMLSELLACRQSASEEELSHLGPILAPQILPKLDAIWAGEVSWSEFLPLLADSTIAAQLFAEPILDRVENSLVSAPSAAISLEGLQSFSKQCPNVLQSVLASDATVGKDLLPNLLLLTESPNEDISKQANKLIPTVQGFLGANGGATPGNAVLDVIQNGLSTAGPKSVSVDTLVNHAISLLDNKMLQHSEALLPDVSKWTEALQPFIGAAPNKSLAITTPLGGAVFLVQSAAVHPTSVERDSEGASVPLRMAMYTAKLITAQPELIELAGQMNELLTLTTSLANDHLSVAAPSNLWSVNEPELLSEIADFVSAAQQILKAEYERAPASETVSKLDLSEDNLSAEAYYLAVFVGKMHFEQEEMQGAASSTAENLEAQLKSIRSKGNVFAIISHLYGHQNALADSTIVMRYCNEIVADLTPYDAEKLQEIGLSQLVILNTILNYYEDAGETIAKARLSRFVSKAVSWLLDEAIEDEIVHELLKLMAHLLPLVSDMYGDYWKDVLGSVKSNLELVSELPDRNAPALVPALHSSLRLFGVLRKIKATETAKDEDERNDDVIEAWTECESQINTAMIHCLKVARSISDDLHQPLMICNELLSREISRIPTSKLSGMEELYPQLYSPSPAVQQAAYRLLHRYIPSKQEQISVDTVLEKTNARLPDELLSLILETPVAADLHEEDFERSTPLQLRGYLLSWLLVFDHFTNASHKVKNDYVDSMKEAGHLGDFLDFAFDFLGHGKGKPLDVSKFDVASYNSSAMEDSPLKDTQWLLTHLYYLCVTFFPALTKNWWIDCKARQKVISVEAWTARFISPLVISTALEEVATWTNTQETAHTSEEPPPLAVKINHRASELTAAYLMDDDGQNALVTVSLPPTFPLHNAKVTSPSSQKAMAVDEKRWNAWLLNTQAIIAFSNNSIIDGLLAWRRNVFGALKGQTECAICYAVVGEDGRVPSKKCRTCKNSFHGGCLFKWFKSSNGTSCPLCRESFNYG